jgi:hypothetical protein
MLPATAENVTCHLLRPTHLHISTVIHLIWWPLTWYLTAWDPWLLIITCQCPRTHVSCVFTASLPDWFGNIGILADDANDADVESDEYDNCDVFGTYNAHTWAEVDRVERDALAASAGKWDLLLYVIFFPTSVARQLGTTQAPTTATTSTAFSTVTPSSATENANIDPRLLLNELPTSNQTSTQSPSHRHCTTPDNAEDGQSRLKELREAATRSQSRKFV